MPWRRKDPDRRGNFPVRRENLDLVDELLRHIGFKKLDFLGQRTGEVGLLDALGVNQFVLAELQHLPVVQPDRQRADEQQSAQNQPKNAHSPGAHSLPGGFKVDGNRSLGRHCLEFNFRGFR